jgi:hypothetical protein
MTGCNNIPGRGLSDWPEPLISLRFPYRAEPQMGDRQSSEDAMGQSLCLLLVGGAALLMASVLLRLPARVRVAVVVAVLAALSAAIGEPIAVSPEFAIASLS